MNSLKKLPMAMTILGLGAVSSFAELKVNDNFGVAGFLDMSAAGKLDSAEDADATLGVAVDQFELDFMFKFDKISARADINVLPSTSGKGDTLTIEQGFVTYTAGSVALNAGRFLSSMGFEAAEPTGLYQYSISKTTPIYGGYQNGASVSYTTPMFGLYGAVVSDLWSSAETDLTTPGFEGQVSATPMEGVTAKATYLYQMLDDELPGGDASQQVANIWGSYAKGALTAAAEFNMLLDWVVPDGATMVNDGTGMGWIAMVNLKFAEHYAATVRYSGLKLGDADPDTEVTFSPSAALTPNWLIVAEVKQELESEITNYALESLFSF